jgi:hypothetical protein
LLDGAKLSEHPLHDGLAARIGSPAALGAQHAGHALLQGGPLGMRPRWAGGTRSLCFRRPVAINRALPAARVLMRLCSE